MSDAPAVHARTADDVLAELDVRRDEGLDEEAVRQRRGAHGPNRLREPERRSALRVLADQFASTVILVLLAAAVLALLARKWTESIAIFAVLVVNASIGFASEWRARRSMQALRALARQSARVRRGGAERTIPADDLVPGDILLFEAGDVVAADARLVSEYFKGLPEVTEVIFDGDTRASVRVIGGIQVDLRVLEPHLFGAGLHYFTGSKEHHIQMRIRSKKIGLKISEKGVYRYDDPTELAAKDRPFQAAALAFTAMTAAVLFLTPTAVG